MKIPKRIIQTAKSLDLPLASKAAVANVKLLNPGYEYLFFDDAQVEKFIDTKFPEHRGIFDSFPVRIQKYDFFRYLAIYHYGGFYFDIDIFLADSLDGLLGLACVFPFEELTIHRFLRDQYGMDWEIGNYAFGAAPGHPFIKAIIDNCIRAQKEPNWIKPMMASTPNIYGDDYYVLNSTGPGLVTRTLAEFPDAAKHVNILFPDDVCNPQNWHNFGNYGVHLQGASWRKPRGLIQRLMIRLWESYAWNKAMAESKKLGGKRSLEFKSIKPNSAQ